MTKIEINEACEGYIWMSDQPNPKTFINEPVNLVLDEGNNPFIIEGQLYVKNKISYSIKYVDGKYFITKYDLSALPTVFESKEYIPNRIKKENTEISKICFNQYWEPKKDVLCENMEMLVPSAYVFVGFKMKED